MDVDAPHSVVVGPSSTEDIVKIIKIATKHRVPVTELRVWKHYREVCCSIISLDFSLIQTGGIPLAISALM